MACTEGDAHVLGRGSHGVRGADVDACRGRRRTLRGDRCRHRRGRVRVDVEHRDRHARASEHLRQRLTQARTPTGDDRDPSGKVCHGQYAHGAS
jgi:hypothetical protein